MNTDHPDSLCSRRNFIRDAASATLFAAVSGSPPLAVRLPSSRVPNYLQGYEALYARDPRAAALRWFREARFGLLIHYGLYSLEGRHEWLQLREKIPVSPARRDLVAELASACARKGLGLCLYYSHGRDWRGRFLRKSARRRAHPFQRSR